MLVCVCINLGENVVNLQTKLYKSQTIKIRIKQPGSRRHVPNIIVFHLEKEMYNPRFSKIARLSESTFHLFQPFFVSITSHETSALPLISFSRCVFVLFLLKYILELKSPLWRLLSYKLTESMGISNAFSPYL